MAQPIIECFFANSNALYSAIISDTDKDGDGLTNSEENKTYGTDPLMDDTDGDGLKDCEEILLGTDPTLFDTDADGYPDRMELYYGTNYLANDIGEDIDLDGNADANSLALGVGAAAEAGVGVGGGISDEGCNVLGCGREAGEIEADAAQKGGLVGFRRRLETGCRKLGADEGIDRMRRAGRDRDEVEGPVGREVGAGLVGGPTHRDGRGGSATQEGRGEGE